jgi:putative transposase
MMPWEGVDSGTKTIHEGVQDFGGATGEPAADEPARGPGVMHHSDRGVQYACESYRQLLAAHGMIASMSGAGDCHDNAVAERFMGALKTEWVHHQRYATREQARLSVFEYIEVFYNRRRRHSTLGYVSPEEYERTFN